jgi:aminomethyltransferase
MSASLKRTPLFESHQELGGRLIEFGGWEMPVQYTSIIDEHQTVRNAAGIFDICHMGEVLISGAGALPFLNYLLTNNAAKLLVGQGQYTQMCQEDGGTVDDLYLYRLTDKEYLLIINASRIDADIAWMQQQLATFPQRGLITFENRSDKFGAVALQGPKAPEFITEVFNGSSHSGTHVHYVTELQKNQIGTFNLKKSGALCWIARTGYTGEDGFEIITHNENVVDVWNDLLAAGKPHGLKAAGLGARDTLRTEVCYPLYGHELDDKTSPIEAGLGVFVSFEKGKFIGHDALLEQKQLGPKKRCVAFKMTDKCAPPRPGYTVWNGEEQVGQVVSGTLSPTLNAGIGLAYVRPDLAKKDTVIQIDIRGKKFAAQVVAKPIYRKAV